MARSSYNVVVILKDARTVSFQANDFRSACLELKRMLPDTFYSMSATDDCSVFKEHREMNPEDGK